ncbi:uncharacterized protein LOC125235894 [Leguminivora glycinivorella]|uniref:uncharacterized protein LOC125235894 n=1 Tax=Leguminivora glycinivorella TaxID=1035111 RepID=UPI00200C65CF|nr:uncharacterized protein LOC125235894 [Leguminivora glycinivorella]
MCTLLVLLDFSRAFDCINIDLLLSKLSYYGLDNSALRWFYSYLTKRHQYVKLCTSDGSTKVSDNIDLSRGADISSRITYCKYHIYADDIQIYITCKPSEIDSAINKLNMDLANIASWALDNSLMLNPTKTKYLIFGTKTQLNKIRPTRDVMLSGELIERVYEARNLGLVMDSELRFEKHVAESVRTCFFRLKLLYNIRPFINETLRIQLIETLVLSKLNYMDLVYGPRLLSKTKRLIQRVQNACTRFCFNVPPRAHVTPFLNKHNILKMLHRRKLHLASLLFGIVKHKSPLYLFEKLSWMSTRRSLAVRTCSIQLITPRHATAAFRGSFKYNATKCWNIIPPPLRNLQSVTSFKTKFKELILKHQQSQEVLRHDTSYL